MRSSHSLDRLDMAFDDNRLVSDAGLLLPATLAAHLGLRELVETHLDLGQVVGRANVGDKLLTLVMSALAGGDCIDDAAALRAGGTAGVLGFAIKAASTLGTFLRSFRWGHVRQLDAVTRHLLARAWAAGAGPARLPSRSISTRRSARHTASRSRAAPTSRTPTPGAITRCSRLPPAQETSSTPASEAATRTPCAAPGAFWLRRSAGYALPERAATSSSGPTRASMPTTSSGSAARPTSASASRSASIGACVA